MALSHGTFPPRFSTLPRVDNTLATMRAPSSAQVVEVALVEVRVLFEAAENPDPSPRATSAAAHVGVALDFAVSQCMHGQAQNIVYAWTTWMQVRAQHIPAGS